MMWAPSSTPVPASATILAKPSTSPTIVALPSARNGNEPVFDLVAGLARLRLGHARPLLICGRQKVTRGMRSMSHRRRVVAGDGLDRHDRLVAGDVGEGEAGHDVADRVQVLGARSA